MAKYHKRVQAWIDAWDEENPDRKPKRLNPLGSGERDRMEWALSSADTLCVFFSGKGGVLTWVRNEIGHAPMPIARSEHGLGQIENLIASLELLVQKHKRNNIFMEADTAALIDRLISHAKNHTIPTR